MLYAILAYHVEAEVMSWTPEQDAAVMTGLLAVHDRLNADKLLGPAALRVMWRLGDGTRLVLLANFADAPFAMPESVSDGRLLYSSGEPPGDEMPPQCAVFYLLMPR